MKKITGRFLWLIVLTLCGIGLIVAAGFGVVDSFWSGMGCGFLAVGGLRLIQLVRYKKNAEYAERLEVSVHDERNLYLAEKARSWSFYWSILLECIAVIVLRICQYPMLSTTMGLLICCQLVLYWGSWLYLKKKH